MGELQVIITGLGFQGKSHFYAKERVIIDIWYLLKNYIVEVDQHFPNTLKPIYQGFISPCRTIIMSKYNLKQMIDDPSLCLIQLKLIFCFYFPSKPVVIFFARSLHRRWVIIWSLSVQFWQRGIISVVLPGSSLTEYRETLCNLLNQSKLTDFSSFRIFKKVLRNPFLLGYYVSSSIWTLFKLKLRIIITESAVS